MGVREKKRDVVARVGVVLWLLAVEGVARVVVEGVVSLCVNVPNNVLGVSWVNVGAVGTVGTRPITASGWGKEVSCCVSCGTVC